MVFKKFNFNKFTKTMGKQHILRKIYNSSLAILDKNIQIILIKKVKGMIIRICRMI